MIAIGIVQRKFKFFRIITVHEILCGNIFFSINPFDQQQKTSSNIKHEKFVPSPEISLSGPEPTISQSNRDSFYPTNQNYRPNKHSVHFHSSAPITTISNWKHSQELQSLPKHFPKFEEEIEQQKENEKFIFPPSSDSGKWYFMPDKHRIEATEKPKPSGNGKWKWVLDDDELDKPYFPANYSPLKTLDYAAPSIPPNDFSYTYEIPSTDSMHNAFNQQSNVEPNSLSTTSSSFDSERDNPFSFSNGILKHKSKAKGNEAK